MGSVVAHTSTSEETTADKSMSGSNDAPPSTPECRSRLAPVTWSAAAAVSGLLSLWAMKQDRLTVMIIFSTPRKP